MEDLLGGEERLQVGDEEEDARFVEGRQFLVQFGVEEGEGALGLASFNTMKIGHSFTQPPAKATNNFV